VRARDLEGCSSSKIGSAPARVLALLRTQVGYQEYKKDIENPRVSDIKKTKTRQDGVGVERSSRAPTKQMTPNPRGRRRRRIPRAGTPGKFLPLPRRPWPCLGPGGAPEWEEGHDPPGRWRYPPPRMPAA
jgi:hypothetical protein